MEYGIWPFRDYLGRSTFPARIEVNGRTFARANWHEAKPRVVAQYREEVDENSRHLYVMERGRWQISHVDRVNPDRGDPIAPVRHFIVDHPAGRALIGVGLTVGLAALIGALIE